MKTIHLKADSSVINELLNIVKKFNQSGKDIEVIDNKTFELENTMINQALSEEKEQKVFSHDDVWNDLLKN